MVLSRPETFHLFAHSCLHLGIYTTIGRYEPCLLEINVAQELPMIVAAQARMADKMQFPLIRMAITLRCFAPGKGRKLEQLGNFVLPAHNLFSGLLVAQL